MSPQDIIIRSFKPADREDVRRISCDTAFMGEPVEKFFDDREAFADVATSYYTEYEPESLFVAEYENSLIGYLTGCKDTRRFGRIYYWRILPGAAFRSLFRGTLFRKKTWRLMLNILKSFFRGELRRPDYHREFPAHLHINVQGVHRQLGTGTRLMEKYLAYLKENKVKGLHLYSFSAIGQEFFKKMNFSQLSSQKISYFEYLGRQDVWLFCFVKHLD
jgi:GNAT superfamily N-acetyltransferase